MKQTCCAMLSLVALLIPATAQTRGSSHTPAPPALPAPRWNVCPGEGCHFGTWTAGAGAPVYDAFRSGRLIGRLAKGDQVTGLTGVMVVYKPGVLRIDKDQPENHLRQGDTILTYTYYGEGVSDVWFHGHFHPKFDISWAQWPNGDGCQNACSAHFLAPGRQIWWVKASLQSGKTGWINSNQANFLDICTPAKVAESKLAH